MIVGTAIVMIYMPWVHSFKEKRSAVKSLCARVKNEFNVSVAEVDEQDTHQTAVIGIACVCTSTAVCDSLMESVLDFMETSTEGEIIRIEREYR